MVLLKSIKKIHQQFQEKLKPVNKITFKNCSQHVLQQVKSHNGHLKGTSSSDLQSEHWNLPRTGAGRGGERKRGKTWLNSNNDVWNSHAYMFPVQSRKQPQALQTTLTVQYLALLRYFFHVTSLKPFGAAGPHSETGVTSSLYKEVVGKVCKFSGNYYTIVIKTVKYFERTYASGRKYNSIEQTTTIIIAP